MKPIEKSRRNGEQNPQRHGPMKHTQKSDQSHQRNTVLQHRQQMADHQNQSRGSLTLRSMQSVVKRRIFVKCEVNLDRLFVDFSQHEIADHGRLVLLQPGEKRAA